MKKAAKYSEDLQRLKEQEAGKLIKKKTKMVNKLPHSTDERVLKRRADFIADTKAITSGIECDSCKTELINYGDIFSSKPPQRRHICLGCGRTYTLPL